MAPKRFSFILRALCLYLRVKQVVNYCFVYASYDHFLFPFSVGIDFINSSWIGFAILGGMTQFYRNANFTTFPKLTQNLRFIQWIMQSLLDWWRSKPCKPHHLVYFCYYVSSSTLQGRNFLSIKRFCKIEKLRKSYGTVNRKFRFPFGSNYEDL